jgi:hypothetical protein
MAGKVLVNLATGMEDAERMLVAFLVATAALGQGKTVVLWATKDAVRLALPALPTFSSSASPRALRQIGQSQSSPPPSVNCWNSRSSAKVVGATPMWEWAGDDTTVFSY